MGTSNSLVNSVLTNNVNGGLAFSTSGLTYNLGGLSGAGSFSLTNVSGGSLTLSVGGNGSANTYSGVLSGGGGLTKVGSGVQVLAGSNTYSGETNISSGTLQLGNGLTNGSVSSGTVTNNSVLALDNAAAQTFSGLISGSGSVAKFGSSLLALGNLANSYSGGTTITGGTLSIAGNGALGTAPATAATNLTLNGGVLQVTATTAISPTRTISLGQNGGTINVAVLSTVSPSAASPSAVFFSGQITGPGGLTVTGGTASNTNVAVNNVGGNGGYILILDGSNNNYQGNTTINNATVTDDEGVLGGVAVNLLPSTTVLTLTNSGVFAYYNGSSTQTLAGLSGDSTTSIGTENNSAGASLTINPGSGKSYTYAGVIGNVSVNGRGHAGTGGGSFPLTLIGQGTEVLTGANVYTGNTTISSGTLQLGGGGGGATGTLAAGSTITDNGTLAFRETANLTQGTAFSTAAISARVASSRTARTS